MQASGAAYDGGFIEFWLGRILFHAAPAWVFIAGYSARTGDDYFVSASAAPASEAIPQRLLE